MAGQGHSQAHSRSHSHAQPHPQHQSGVKSRPGGQKTGQATNDNTNINATSPKVKLRTSCDACQEAKLGCSQEKPTCRRCSRHGTTCVYSPFRRIGRPRKSTNSRSNATKSRAKVQTESSSEDVVPSIEDLADVNGMENNSNSIFVDPVPAPPSSPASTENGGGSWYPWTSDGNSLFTGLPMNLDTPISMLEAVDPFGSTAEYLDMETYLNHGHHGMLGNGGLPAVDETLDIGHPMQPTPPSSIDTEMLGFDDVLAANQFQHHRPMTASTSSTSEAGPGITYGDFSNIDTGRDSDSRFTNEFSLRHPPQLMTNLDSTNQYFAPSPELTPPLSAQSPKLNPCTKRCSSALIQKLASLNDHLSDKTNSSMDVILQVERDTCSLCHKILGCSACNQDKSNYLLFSMVIDQVVRLLETIPKKGASQSFTLTVGNFELDQDTKVTFLRKYLLQRVGQLASMLKEFAQTVDDNAKDYNSSAAKEMLRDVYQRLDALRRTVELTD